MAIESIQPRLIPDGSNRPPSREHPPRRLSRATRAPSGRNRAPRASTRATRRARRTRVAGPSRRSSGPCPGASSSSSSPRARSGMRKPPGASSRTSRWRRGRSRRSSRRRLRRPTRATRRPAPRARPRARKGPRRWPRDAPHPTTRSDAASCITVSGTVRLAGSRRGAFSVARARRREGGELVEVIEGANPRVELGELRGRVRRRGRQVRALPRVTGFGSISWEVPKGRGVGCVPRVLGVSAERTSPRLDPPGRRRAPIAPRGASRGAVCDTRRTTR